MDGASLHFNTTRSDDVVGVGDLHTVLQVQLTFILSATLPSSNSRSWLAYANSLFIFGGPLNVSATPKFQCHHYRPPDRCHRILDSPFFH